jgi:Ca2+-binding RTX toxin-like protein
MGRRIPLSEAVKVKAVMNRLIENRETEGLSRLSLDQSPVRLGGSLAIPSSQILTTANYLRSGPDLLLQGLDGEQILIKDYFASGSPPDLVSEDGARLPAELVVKLAGPLAPAQYAQFGGRPVGQAIGRVETLSGQVDVTHADGGKEALAKGSAVYQGDILQTASGSAVGLLLADQSSLSLGARGRLVLDQLVYDPGNQGNVAVISLVHGTFSFISGQIAKTTPEAMKVLTPVAVIGIRGTVGTGGYVPGKGLTAAIIPEGDAVTGEITITNAAGVQVLNQPNTAIQVSTYFSPPSSPFAVTEQQISSNFGQTLLVLPPSGAASGAVRLLQQNLQEQRKDMSPGFRTESSGDIIKAPEKGQAGTAPNEKAAKGEDGFALAAQQAIDQLLARGVPVEQAQQMALTVKAAFLKALGGGASVGDALLQAGQAAERIGFVASDMMGKNPFLQLQQGPFQREGLNEAVPQAPHQAAAAVLSTSASEAIASSVAAPVFHLPQTAQNQKSGDVLLGGSRDDTLGTSRASGTVQQGPSTVSGRAIDGYIEGATVFADANQNGILDAGEVSTTTGTDGAFTLTGGSGPLVVMGGVDASTGQSFTGVLTAPQGATVITPLTTLMDAMIRSEGLSLSQAKAKVAEAVGLTGGADIASLDPVAASLDPAQASMAAEIMAAGVKIHNTIVQAANLIIGADAGIDGEAAARALYSSLATIMITNGATTDISGSASHIEAMISDAAGSGGLNLGSSAMSSLAAAKAEVANVILASNQAVEDLSGSGSGLLVDLAKIATVAQKSSAEAIRSAVTDSAQLDTLSGRFSGAALNVAVAAVEAAVASSSRDATAGNDEISGTTNADTIDGLAGDDTLSGGAGADDLAGGEGHDTLYGGAGGDVLKGGAGNDRLFGGEGQDIATFDGAMEDHALTLTDRRIFITGEGRDQVQGVEVLRFADGDLAVGSAEGRRMLINGETQGDQTRSHIAAFDDGRLIAVWQSSEGDGSGSAILARSFDPDGHASAEIRINAFGQGNQGAPRVAALEDGTAVVVWESWGQDGDQGGIYAQRLTHGGAKLGGEFRISDQAAGSQTDPDVVALKGGGFAVAWVEGSGRDGGGEGVFARSYQPGAAATDPYSARAAFRVSITTAGDQDGPALAALDSGGFAAVWSQGDGSAAPGVLARSFSADGAGGAEVRLSSQPGSDPDVTRLANGKLAAVWRHPNDDGSGSGKIILFSHDGATVGNAISLDASANIGDAPMSISALGDGRFAVAWTGVEIAADGAHVSAAFGRRFEASGAAAGSAFRLGPQDGGASANPSITSLPNGDFAIAWEDQSGRDGDQGGVYLKRFASDGSAYGYSLTGTSADDLLPDAGGFVSLDGGEGWDTLQLGGSSSRFKIEAAGDGFAIVDQAKDEARGNIGIDKVVNVETLLFQNAQFDIALGGQGLNLTGSSGDDVLTLGKGVADVVGGAGNDVIRPDAKIDLSRLAFDGGAGEDSASLGLRNSLQDSDLAGMSSVEKIVVEANLSAAHLALGANSEAAGITCVEARPGSGALTLDASGRAHAITALGAGGGDTLTGGAGGDTLTGGGGDDRLAGEGGADVAVFAGRQSGYSVSAAHGIVTVRDIDASDGDEGTDSLSGIETLRFSDGNVGIAQIGEFNVNPRMEEGRYPRIAPLQNGGFIAAWNGYDYEASSAYSTPCVYLQRYDSEGVPEGEETRATLTRANINVAPDIAVLSGGGYVLTWTADHPTQNLRCFMAQRFAADGTPLGDEIEINGWTSNAWRASICPRADGGFSVAWEIDNAAGNDYGVYSRTYDSHGAPLGASMLVTPTLAVAQGEPSIAGLAGGGHVVVWHSNVAAASDYSIYARLYGANGNALGSPIQVNASDASLDYAPDVLALTQGGFVVAWEKAEGSDGHEIYLRRFNASGVAIGDPVHVNTSKTGHQTSIEMAALADGGFVVTWQGPGSNGDIYLQRFASNGEPVGGEVEVPNHTTEAQGQPAIAGLADGGFVVIWQADRLEGDSIGIYAQRFDANGAPAGPASLTGGAGNDTIHLGAGIFAVSGGLGADTLTGSDGCDVFEFQTGEVSAGEQIDGGAGNDVIAVTGEADFTQASLQGIEGLRFNDASSITLSGQQASHLSTLHGDANSNQLTVTASFDGYANLTSLSGIINWRQDDIILLSGDAGRETLTGSIRSDTLWGGGGADTMLGGAGDDVFELRAGDAAQGEAINGGEGIDTLRALGDADLRTSSVSAIESLAFSGSALTTLMLAGNALGGVTALSGDAYANSLVVQAATGGAADLSAIADFISWTPGVDSITVLGQDGNETLIGSLKSDDLRGGGGDDTLSGGQSSDTLDGGSGDDVLIFDPTDALIQGGDGVDALLIEGVDSVTDFRNLQDSLAQNIEVIDIRGNGGATLRMATSDVLALSGSTDEVVVRGEQGDRLHLYGNWSSAGTQIWQGGVYQRYQDGSAAILAPSSVEIASWQSGTSGDDTLSGTSGSDNLAGDLGNDLLSGGGGDDTLSGGSGSDVAKFAGLKGGYLIRGGLGSITVTDINLADGNEGSDLLTGFETLRFADGDLQLQTKWGENRVNTTAGNATTPDIAALADGGYVIAWDGRISDDSEAAALQRYAPSGAPSGFETRLNSETSNAQSNVAVTGLASGGYVAIWSSYQQDGNSGGVYGQIYGSSGARAGTEFRVNTTVASNQNYPAIAALQGGGFVAVWENLDGNGNCFAIRMQRYDASGNAAGGETSVTPSNSVGQRDPSVAGLQDGGFIVVWSSSVAVPNDYFVLARRYDASGNPSGAIFQIDAPDGEYDLDPRVIALGDGGFAVAWESRDSVEESTNIHLARYTSQGTPQGGEIIVNTMRADFQGMSDLAALNDGGLVVVWESQAQDGSGKGVFLQRYSSTGQVVGAERQVNTYTNGNQGSPRISGLADGGYVVSWESAGQDGNSYGVYSQRYDSEDNPVGPYRLVGGASSDSLSLDGSFLGVAGGGGADTLLGGSGDDRFEFAPGDVTLGEVVNGAGGTDTVFLSGSNDFSVAALSNVEVLAFQTTATATLSASSALSLTTLVGSVGNSTLIVKAGAGGQASLANVSSFIDWTLGGNTISLVGSTGAETLTGSSQRDLLSGGTGNDTLTGGGGNDWLTGGAGMDWQSGGAGNDLFDFAAGDVVAGESIDGGAGADTIEARGTNDFSLASLANIEALNFSNISSTSATFAASQIAAISTISGSSAQNGLIINASPNGSATLAGIASFKSWGDGGDWIEINGSTGSEALTGSYTHDTLRGGAGSDTLDGAVGKDLLFGDEGDDTLIFDFDDVSLAGGAGTDTMKIDANGAWIDLRDIDNSVISGIEAIDARGFGANTLRMATADVLALSDSSDQVALRGDAADKLYLYGAWTAGGAQTVSGVTYSTFTDGSATVLAESGMTVSTWLEGGAGNDTFAGSAGTDRVDGGAGADIFVLSGTMSGYQIKGENGFVTVTDINPADGDQGIDTLFGIETLRFSNGDVSLSQQGEFRVNTTTASEQKNPAVAALKTEGFVAVWDGNFVDDTSAVVMQMYDGNGVPQGRETRVNTSLVTTNYQSKPAVAVLNDGSFVVTWTSSPQDGSSGGVYGQRFSQAGAPLGGEFAINTYTKNDQTESTVAALADGGFVVAWQSYQQDGWSNAICAKQYSSTGAAVTAEFMVNTTKDYDQRLPSLAGLSGGGYVIAWTNFSSDGSWENIYARTYGVAGRDSQGEFRVNTTVDYTQDNVDLTALADGGFLATWSGDSGYKDIFAQKFGANGLPVGAEFRVNTTTAGNQIYSDSAALKDGGFAVVWQSELQDGSGTGIYLQRFDADAQAVGGETLVNVYTSQDQALPVIAGLNDGGFIVTWASSGQDGSLSGIFGQRFDNEGNRTGPFSVAGSAISDVLTTASGFLAISGGAGADTLTGGAGNDRFDLAAGEFASGEEVDGGAGVDTLRLTGSNNFSLGTVSNIETLVFDGAASSTATFAGSQIASLAAVVGDSKVNSIAVTASAGSAVSLAGIAKFVSWTAGSDTITLNGATGNETLTGSSQKDSISGGAGNDTITGGAGNDILSGGDGNDLFLFSASDVVAGESVDGGLGADTLGVAGTNNFSLGTISNIEAISFTAAATATFAAAQTTGFATVTGHATTANALVINAAAGGTASLAGISSFFAWTGGTDTITLNGSTGGERLTGSSQSDYVTGGAGADTLTGGAGDDRFDFAAGDVVAGETIDGGIGTDSLRLMADADFSLASMTGIEGLTYAGASRATLTGGQASALLSISGDASANSLIVNVSSGGAASLSGATFSNWTAGSDSITLSGSTGNETLSGGSQVDVITGGGGADTLSGGGGNDLFLFSTGDVVAGESIDGGAGIDAIRVSGNADFSNGGLASIETLAFATAASVTFNEVQIGALTSVAGDANANAIIVQASLNSSASLSGIGSFTSWTAGTDTVSLLGAAGSETLTGSTQDDTLSGGTGADTLLGGAGNDSFTFAEGDVEAGETIDGGAGQDALSLTGSNDFRSASIISLESLTYSGEATASFTSAQFAGIASIRGDAHANHLLVTTTADQNASLTGIASFANWASGIDTITLRGALGNELLTGSSQNDTIVGGAGLDTLRGGAGSDTFDFSAGDIVAGESVDGGTGTDNLRLFASADFTQSFLDSVESVTFAASATATFTDAQMTGISSIAGDETSANRLEIAASLGGALNLGGVGFSNWTAGVDHVVILGSGGAETLTGTGQRDTVIGGAGADTLAGGAGDDRFDVAAGDVVSGENLDGGSGTDTLHLLGSVDFRAASFSGIEALSFASSASASFNSAQLSGLSTVTGDGNANALVVYASLNATASLAGITTFVAWTSGQDAITLNGASGSETLTGSSQDDVIAAGSGDDTLTGGLGIDTLLGEDGHDVFVYSSAHFASGETLDGGAGNDVLRMSGNNNFAGGSLASIESLTFAGNATATFSARQAEMFASVAGDASANIFAVNLGAGETVALSGAAFSNWDQMYDSIRLNGSTSGETMTGTAQAETFSGGSGADTLSGMAGDDVFIFGGGDVAAGEQILGGAGSDALLLQGSENFQTSTLASLEGLTYFAEADARFAAGQIGSGLASNAMITGDTHANSLTIAMDAGQSLSLANFSFAHWNEGQELDWVTIGGSTGDENITGSSQNDSISSGAGSDVLIGLGGGDHLTGGQGSDMFVERTGVSALSSRGDNLDMIQDFNWFSEGDRLYFLDDSGSHMNISVFYSAGNLSDANSLGQALTWAFADANGTQDGTVVLGAGQAVCFDYSGVTYVSVGDANAGYQVAGDAVIGLQADAAITASTPVNPNDVFG